MVIGPPGLAGMVGHAGHQFRAGGEPPESVIGPIREQLPILPSDQASVLGNCVLFGQLATAAMLPDMEQVVRDWKPDLVLRDPCEYASAVVALRRAVPTAQVAIGLATVEHASIEVATPALEAHHRELVAHLIDAPYLSRFPASVDPSPFSATRRFRLPSQPPGVLLPDWWNGSTAPLVYVSFGTVLGYMSIAADVFRAALDAVAGLDARVLLTVGRRFDLSELGPVPANVHVEAWIDQGRLLGEADLVVCHGGAGTTFAALAAGVPLVVVPVFADQFVNGDCVAASGAGLVVYTDSGPQGHRRPPERADAPRIRQAIAEVLATPSCGTAARRVADEMASAPDIDDVLRGLVAAA